MPLNGKKTIPPGQHPCDPAKANIDPIGYSLKKVQTYLVWLGEHAAAYEEYRNVDSSKSQNELSCLKDAYQQAILHMQRLTELILAGHRIDTGKALPRGICSVVWSHLVQSIEEEKKESKKGHRD